MINLKMISTRYFLFYAKKIPRSKILNNIFSLFILKGAEYIISFITLPFLIRTLGVEKFGAITFMQVLVNYMILVSDYGFALTAPRDVAKSSVDNLPRLFSSIMITKLLLAMSGLLLSMVLMIVFRPNIDYVLLLCIIPSLVGNIIFPIWYYQGKQEMKFITMFNLIARTLSLIGILVFIREESDYLKAALLLSITPLIAGCISLITLLRKEQLFCIPTIDDLKMQIRQGWDIFISTLFINVYTNSNVFILGILTNDIVVGYFASASKIIDAIKGLITPVSNATFPHISLLYQNSKRDAVFFIQKLTKVIGIITLCISFISFIFAEKIVMIITGNEYYETILVFKIISFLPFIVSLSNIFGIQTLVAFGMQRTFSRILMFSALLDFIIVFPLVELYGIYGMALTVLLVESLVTIGMYYSLIINDIKLF